MSTKLLPQNLIELPSIALQWHAIKRVKIGRLTSQTRALSHSRIRAKSTTLASAKPMKIAPTTKTKDIPFPTYSNRCALQSYQIINTSEFRVSIVTGKYHLSSVTLPILFTKKSTVRTLLAAKMAESMVDIMAAIEEHSITIPIIRENGSLSSNFADINPANAFIKI